MLKIPAAPPEEALFGRYAVTLNGKPAPVWLARVSRVPYNTEWPGHQRPLDQTEPAGFCAFESDGPVAVRVTVDRPFHNIRIRPQSAGIHPTVQGNTVTFTLPRPGQYTVEPDGFHEALHLFQDSGRKERFPDRDVLRFSPGVHRVGTVELHDNQTVVLEPGAVVYGAFVACCASNVTVTGCGIIDDGWEERRDDTQLMPTSELEEGTGNDPFDFSAMDADELRRYLRGQHELSGCLRFYNCRNVTVSHVVCRDSSSFTIMPANCENVVIDEVKLIGNWRYNADGIDFCSCRNCVLRNSFLRNFDDCVVVKGLTGWGHKPIRNLLVENCVIWCDWGRALEIGAETNADEYCSLLFRNCDVVHGSWVQLDIQHHNDAEIRGIVFDDIRCEYTRDQLPLKMQDFDGQPYEAAKPVFAQPALLGAFFFDMGRYGARHSGQSIRDVVFRNIRVLSDEDVPMPECSFQGLDAENMVRDVQIDGLYRNGKRLTTPQEANLARNEFTSGITLK